MSLLTKTFLNPFKILLIAPTPASAAQLEILSLHITANLLSAFTTIAFLSPSRLLK